METKDGNLAPGQADREGGRRGADNAGSGHPLPDSDEARHDEIPESLEHDKGKGDDAREPTQATPTAVAPDGTPYPTDDATRGEDLAQDQAAHQDRGQSGVDDA